MNKIEYKHSNKQGDKNRIAPVRSKYDLEKVNLVKRALFKEGSQDQDLGNINSVFKKIIENIDSLTLRE